MLRFLTILFLASIVVGVAVPSDAGELPDIRPYITLRTSIGPSGAIFTHPDSASEVQLKSPSDENFFSGALGFDWGRYLGGEVSLDFVETGLEAPGTGKVGEYAMWTMLGQLRVRYPLWQDRLVPYLLAGAGIGTGEFNDRSVQNKDYPISGPLDTSPVVALGGGVDYFVARNIAIGIEAKQRFLFETEVEVAGQTRELDLNSTVWSAGLRIYHDGEKGLGRGLPPADSDALRGYLALRAGGAVFTSRDDSVGVELVSPAAPVGSATLGVNLSRHWGFEVAVDTVETELEAVDTPGIKRLGEYTLLAATAQVRLRYPVMEDRLAPYLVAGGGVGFGEFNDRANPIAQFDVGGDSSWVGLGVVGGGLDYFLADNVAIGVEAKHLFLFESKIKVNQQPRDFDLDSVLLTAGIRVFFP